MEHITFSELLGMFEPEVHDAIQQAADRTHASHVVVFENVNLDSSSLGARTALCVGPTCTTQDIASCEGKKLGTQPSNFQHPVAYADAPGREETE